LPEGHFTSIVVMLLIRLGLDDGSLLKDPDFVLDSDEVALIQERIDVFNEIIENGAASIKMPLIDINALFEEIDKDPPTFFGIPVTPRFLGGIFSLDGVHPSNIGHALAANAFIETINSHFHLDIPLISDRDLHRIFLRDPFQDKDGDGRVRGRFGAGLLETLGPVLGISGDQNDFVPDGFSLPIDPALGRQFIQRFLTLQGRDSQMASEWNTRDAIEAFRHIFGLEVFTGP
jgi:phospholipase/lecithinase/hemolysin